VSFSTRLSIRDPKIPSNTAAFLDTSIIFELTTSPKVGITGLLEEQEDKYGLYVYECDANNNRLPVVKPKSQQDSLRLCIEPDEVAKNDAVRMYGINSLTLDDGQNTQNVLTDGSLQNSATSENSCTLDGKLCFIETTINNSFFVKEQTVSASGVAGLQYMKDNGRRTLIEAPVRVRRRTRTAGGPAGQKPFDLSFAVEPSTTTYEARAYLCDQSQKELAATEIEPKRHGESVFVCVSPTQDAKNQGIFIRDIKSFVLSKDGEKQILENANEKSGNEQPGSGPSYNCTAGDEVCSFSILLADSFFNGNGEPITGEGEVELQFGNGKATWVRRMALSLSTFYDSLQRSMQENDPDFAGVAFVLLTIPVDPTSTAPPAAWASQSLNFWTSMPTYGKVLAVLGIIIGIAVFLLGAWCFIYGLDSFHFNPFFNQQDDPFYDYDCEDYEGDYTDPEEGPRDTVVELKGEDRGRSLESVDRRKSKLKSLSPGRNTNDSDATKSLSSHSRGEISPQKHRGRSRDAAVGRMRSLSPTRTIKSVENSLKSRSFHGRIDTVHDSERRERTKPPPNERLKSVSPSRRSSGGPERPASTQTFFGLGNNSTRETRSKGLAKPASMDNILGWFGISEQSKKSPPQKRSTTRSLSPNRETSVGSKPKSAHGRILLDYQKPPKTPKKDKSTGKPLKPASAHGLPKDKLGQATKTKKSASTHGPRKVPPDGTSSTHSRSSSAAGRKTKSSSTHSRKNSSKSKNKKAPSNIGASTHSVHSCSSISEVSVDSGDRTRMKGRKNDVMSTSSTHSVQSFASSGSFCSTDSELEVTTGVKRGKRPGAKGKKTKGPKMENSYDIVHRLD
jgi:hypothetical protein